MRAYSGDPIKLAAPDPVLSAELLNFVANRYGLSAQSPRKLGGSFNLNVLLNDHVLRVYGPWVSAERLSELQRIRQTLQARGVPVPDLRLALDGSPWCIFGDCVLEVERYVDGAPMKSLEQLRLGMRMLGQLHSLMADLEVNVPPPLANHLPEELALAATEDVIALIHTWGPTPQEERYAEIAETLARTLPVMDLPRQPVHGDFWHNNVLFREDALVAILDFDFMGMRPRVDDLALPLSYFFQFGGQLADVRELIAAYDSGATPPLSDDERRALPSAMARMALSFLQYLLIPGGEAYAQRARREFNTSRGPACEWWLNAWRDPALQEVAFI